MALHTLKRISGAIGLPTWEVKLGANTIGVITDCGPDGAGMRWRGHAADRTPFSAVSKAKLVQKLEIHAAAERRRTAK